MTTYTNVLNGQQVEAEQVVEGGLYAPFDGSEPFYVPKGDWAVRLPYGAWIGYSDTAFRQEYAEGAARPARITPWEFRRRFTLLERIAIDNVEGSGLASDVIATVRTLRNDFAAALVIDLEDAELAQGIGYLESIGLLANGRAAELLTP